MSTKEAAVLKHPIATKGALFQSRRAWVPPTRAPSEPDPMVQIRRRFLFTMQGNAKTTRWKGHKHLMHSIGYWCTLNGCVMQSYERDKANVDAYGFGTIIGSLAALKRAFEARYLGMTLTVSEVNP